MSRSHGSTAEEDRAFRRGQPLEALTEALVRLKLRQIRAEIESRKSGRPPPP
jgi:hypothetical protein